ncbi:arginine deiminase-related protein [Peribacillus simplex]|uniref:arginine deiminase-related protein n=1 Tax=Peribacillus simplex TaxID=1478 RepID=UPI003D2E8FEB
MEGGGILIDRDTIYVGISGRSTNDPIYVLQEEFPDFQIHAIPFSDQYLYLDCVFNIISKEDALIYIPAFSIESRLLLSSRYNLIEVDAEERFSMGTNILSIGNKTIMSLPNNWI